MNITEIYKGSLIAENISRLYKGAVLEFERNTLDEATLVLLAQAAIDGYTPPSGDSLTILNNLIVYLKAQGLWTLIDVLWLPATNGDSNFACYNLKDPTNHNLTKMNSPLHTSLEGFTGNGGYLDTNWIPETDGVNFTLNSGSIGAYIRTNSDNTLFGTRNNSSSRQIRLIVNGQAGTNFMALNSANNNMGVDNTGLGLHWVNRPDSSTLDYYHNASLITNRTQSTVNVPSRSLLLLAGRGSSGSATDLSPDQLSYAFAGADLSSKKYEVHSAIQTYMTAIGKQV